MPSLFNTRMVSVAIRVPQYAHYTTRLFLCTLPCLRSLYSNKSLESEFTIIKCRNTLNSPFRRVDLSGDITVLHT